MIVYVPDEGTSGKGEDCSTVEATKYMTTIQHVTIYIHYTENTNL